MTSPILLRAARSDDTAALVRLAALDSARPLPGPALVAEQNSTLVAALCLSTGRAIADPFVPALYLIPLLRVEAKRRTPSVMLRGRPLPARLALRR
jgi:hypothetical protein